MSLRHSFKLTWQIVNLIINTNITSGNRLVFHKQSTTCPTIIKDIQHFLTLCCFWWSYELHYLKQSIFSPSVTIYSPNQQQFLKTGNPWRIQIFYLEMPILYKWDVSLKINEWFGNYLLVSLLHFFKILTRLCIDVYKYALMWTPIADFYITPCFYYSLCLFLLMSVTSIFQFFRVRFVL